MDKEYIVPRLKKLSELLYKGCSGKFFAKGNNKKGYRFGVISHQGRVKIENKVTLEVAIHLLIK